MTDPALFPTAVARYRAGDHAGAAALFADVLAGAPGHAAAWRLRGLALLRTGAPREALIHLARAVHLAPGDHLAHLHHGIGLLTAGQAARAAARFRRATMLAPDDPAGWTNFSSALLLLDRPQAARAASRRALARRPDEPVALQLLARGHAAEGQFDDAIAILRRIVQAHPKSAAAWIDLGLLHARRGAMGFARQAMQQALAADPDNAAARANLAGIMVLTGEQTEAIATLRAVLTRDPGCVPARLNLANALLLDREAAAAADVLEGPVPGGREGAHWRAQRALAMILLRRHGEAERLLDAIVPPWGDAEILIVNRRLQLARRADDHVRAADLAMRLATLSTEHRFLFEHRIIACFDLGRYFLGLGDRAAAFAQWQAGHALLKTVQPFSRDTLRNFVDTSIARFDAASLRDGPRAQNGDMSPVFIVGLPRSGTSLTEQILASHGQVHGAGERVAVHELIADTTNATLRAEGAERLAALDAATLDTMATAFLRDLHAEAPGATRIIDKMPGNVMHLGFLARLLPGARIIVCTRDPRDIGLSIFQLRFFGYHPYAHDLADLGFAISEHVRLVKHWRAALPLPMIEVALRDWTDDFDGTLVRVLAFLDLPHDPACTRFHENPRRVRTASASQIREPLNRRGIGRWRGYADQLAPLVDALSPAAREGFSDMTGG